MNHGHGRLMLCRFSLSFDNDTKQSSEQGGCSCVQTKMCTAIILKT